MNKNKILFASIIVVLLLPFISCKKKYPEGPRVSVYTPRFRLIGAWNIEKILVNNKDVTKIVLDTVEFDGFMYFSKADYHDGYNFDSFYLSITYPDNSLWAIGSWSLSEDETTLGIGRSAPKNDSLYHAPLPSLITTGELWTILKLKRESLWIQHIDLNGNIYEIHAIK